MPQDIFISYSSKDKEKADQLSELLASAGLSVWIDQQGIDVATSWSKEIVTAIDGCKAFVVLLSPNSVGSVNVVREVSLASEQKKKILPLDLEPVELSEDLRYHLAGIQRASMTNIDAIIRALGKLGLEATQAPTMKLVKESDERKSLMILPFDDLSPTGDNGWFADGIANELISALSIIKSLRVADQQATKDYKRYQGTLPKYAAEMSIRYFIQGDIRKFGDQIKISSSLLDIETGDHLWQDSMKGTMDDIFDIQEKVANKVVEGLKLHLASDEKKKFSKHGTENAEAYELYLKALEYANRQTKVGFRLAIQLFTEATLLDPNYARAYQFKAATLTNYYRNYDRDPAVLDEAEMLCKEALRLKPDLFDVYYPLSQIYCYRSMFTEAETIAKKFIEGDPQNSLSHFTLAFYYSSTEQSAKAITPYEEAVRLQPDHLSSLWNLVVACEGAKDWERCARWASVALPQFERHLKLHPDDENRRMQHAFLLFLTGRTEAAHSAAMELVSLKDGNSLYNAGCLLARLGEKVEAMRSCRKAIEAGYSNIRHLKEFLSDETEGILSLAGTPEYEEVKQMVAEKEAMSNGKANG